MVEQRVKVITLLKIDIKNVYERITKRSKEYLATFALKRTREHFSDIFFNRYKDFHISDLQLLGEETIVAVDQFYQKVDEIFWYLSHTQDMPNAVEDRIIHWSHDLALFYQTASLYVDAELGNQAEETEEAL